MTTDSEHPVQATPGIERHYGLDWLRIGAFALLILYHIGMVFVTGSWLVKTARPMELLAYPMLLVTPWRLGLLFIVSGYASRALIAKRGSLKRFAGGRSKRLLIPLFFAMVFLIPPQSWVNLCFNHGYAGAFWPFWLHDYFLFGAVDGVTLPEWQHLWFVFYLWLYTMILAAGLLALPPPIKAWLTNAFAALAKGNRLLWLPLLYFLPARVAITFTLGETHGLFDDWLSDLIFMPLFLFGFGLAGARALWPAIARVWRAALVLALAGYAVLAAIESVYPGTIIPPHAVMALSRAAFATMLWCTALVMLHLADTWLKRDHPWRAWLSEAVFPFYIIHQTAIVLIGWWLLPLHLPPRAEFLIILTGTGASCWLFYDIGRRIDWLRPLIGLERKPRALSFAAAAETPSPA